MLSAQMERTTNFFGAPPARNTPVSQDQSARLVEVPTERDIDRMTENRALRQVIPPQAREEPERVPFLVNRHQDADQVVMQARQNNYEGHNNIANVVEALLTQNGLNMGLCRPNFVSALSEYVLMTELPRNWKVPKFTKFNGETNESTVKHIARYLIEAGDISNNENLKMKYFPSYLTKKCFYLVYYPAPTFYSLLDPIRKGFS